MPEPRKWRPKWSKIPANAIQIPFRKRLRKTTQEFENWVAQGLVKRLPLGSQRAPRLEPEIAKNVLRTPCGTGARKRCGRGQARKSPLKVLPTRKHLFDWAQGSQRPPNVSLKTVGCTHKGSNRQQERRSTKPLAPQLLFNAGRRLKFLSTFIMPLKYTFRIRLECIWLHSGSGVRRQRQKLSMGC